MSAIQINTYISVHDYLREYTGQQTSLLLGNLMKIGSGGAALGATSLPVTPATTVNLNVNDPITVFDGSNTEIVFVTATTNAGATSIPISATLYAHAAGVSCCSDGTKGSLAENIIEGCAAVECVARQAILYGTLTDTLPLLSMRSCVDNTNTLIIRPRQFPVLSVSSIIIEFNASSSLTLDTAQVFIQSTQRVVTVPVIKSTSASTGYQLTQYIDSTTPGNVVITYTAGFQYAQLPFIIKRCAVWLTSDLLSDRANPTGAAESRMGQQQLVAYLRGDLSGESALVKRARRYLAPYTQEAW